MRLGKIACLRSRIQIMDWQHCLLQASVCSISVGILVQLHAGFRHRGDGKIQKCQDIHLSSTSPNLRGSEVYCQFMTFLYISSIKPAKHSQAFSKITQCGPNREELILQLHGVVLKKQNKIHVIDWVKLSVKALPYIRIHHICYVHWLVQRHCSCNYQITKGKWQTFFVRNWIGIGWV